MSRLVSSGSKVGNQTPVAPPNRPLSLREKNNARTSKAREAEQERRIKAGLPLNVNLPVDDAGEPYKPKVTINTPRGAN